MSANALGKIYTAAGKQVRIGIRPESAENAYPGDDLLLLFRVKYTDSSGKEVFETMFSTKDSDYLAVYDKKLVWRANLYIEQPEPALGNTDWNNAHPWNVPPAPGTEQAEVRPVDWSAEWGYNEWNRTYDGSQNTNTLSGLAAGNGGQVVTFPEFTPLRTLPSGQAHGSKNVLSKTVAYSYPDHPEETADGDAGSMDSPFDFIWKMRKQGAGEVISLQATNSKWKNYKKGNSTNQMFIPSLGLLYKFLSSESNESPWNQAANTTNTVSDSAYWNWKYTFEAGTDCVGFIQRAASYKYGRHYGIRTNRLYRST